MKQLSILFALLTTIASSGVCNGQPPKQVVEQETKSPAIKWADLPKSTLRVGDDIKSTRKMLDLFSKKNSVGGFSFVKDPDDIENIIISIDENHMNGCAWYSKSTGKITRISIVCFPNKGSGKITHSWLGVEAIQFNRDGTYTITFPKPLTVAELNARKKQAIENRPKPEYPTFRK